MNAVVLRNSPSAFMNHESGTNFWNAKQDTVSHNSVRLHPVVALIVLIKRNMQHPFSIDVSKYQNSIIQRCAPSFENYWGKSSVFNQQDNKCATNTIQSRMGQSVYKLGTSKLLLVHVYVYIYIYIYMYTNVCVNKYQHVYRVADRSLVRPGSKQATTTEDFDVHMSYSRV